MVFSKTLKLAKAFEKFAQGYGQKETGDASIENALYRANLTPYDRNPDEVGSTPGVDINAPFTQGVISVLDKHGVGAFSMYLKVMPSGEVVIVGNNPRAVADLNKMYADKMSKVLIRAKALPDQKTRVPRRGAFLELT
jgi:hypothetical protein